MGQLTEAQQRMADWSNELRFESQEYSIEKIISISQEAINFACSNFQDKEIVYEGYEYEFEERVEKICKEIS